MAEWLSKVRLDHNTGELWGKRYSEPSFLVAETVDAVEAVDTGFDLVHADENATMLASEFAGRVVVKDRAGHRVAVVGAKSKDK